MERAKNNTKTTIKKESKSPELEEEEEESGHSSGEIDDVDYKATLEEFKSRRTSLDNSIASEFMRTCEQSTNWLLLLRDFQTSIKF